jgi:DNA-binding NarL/FixJ family response regulator
MARPLTSREMDVLAMLARGSAIREVADAFDIAERSVRAHIQMVVDKLGVNDTEQVVLRDRIVAP